MASLYANENFPVDVVAHLRTLGHDVLTTHETGKSNLGIEDDAVLQFAVTHGRCVITVNRRDFMRLHRAAPQHAGIVVCTENRNYADFANRIDAVLREAGGDLTGKLLRVVRGDPA